MDIKRIVKIIIPIRLSWERFLCFFLTIWTLVLLGILYSAAQKELMRRCFVETLSVFKNNTLIVKRTVIEGLKEEFQECGKERLVGRIIVDQSVLEDLKGLEENLTRGYPDDIVHKGGWHKPKKCKATSKVAIIIPYRNRYDQLKIFLRHMHPFMQRQQLYYRIFVIEQMSTDEFNRAGLFNIGYRMALQYFSEFDCMILSDVDLLPENDYNSYGCPYSPMHLSVAIDYADYELLYDHNFGGVSSFKRQDYERVNGMSNLYSGWGGEDDDLYDRITEAGFMLYRPSQKNGTYTSVTVNHYRSSEPNPFRKQILRYSKYRMFVDGLNTMKYDLVEVKEEPLYTLAKVVIRKETYRNVFTKCFHHTL